MPLQQNIASYSYVLSPNCTNQDNTYGDQGKAPCTFSTSIRGGYFLNPITTLEVFNNISAVRSVNEYDGAYPPHAFLGIPGNGAPQQRDFVATTFSVATECKPATGDCNVSADNITSGAGSFFNCKKYPAWWGLVNGPQSYFQKQYFTDSAGTQNHTGGKISNPFYVSFTGMTIWPRVTPLHSLKTGTQALSRRNSAASDIFSSAVRRCTKPNTQPSTARSHSSLPLPAMTPSQPPLRRQSTASVLASSSCGPLRI